VGWCGQNDDEVLVLATRLYDADYSARALQKAVGELHGAYARIAALFLQN